MLRRSSVDAAVDIQRLQKGLQRLVSFLICCSNVMVLMSFSRLEQEKVAFQYLLCTENTCSFIFLQNKPTIWRQVQLILVNFSYRAFYYFIIFLKISS